MSKGVVAVAIITSLIAAGAVGYIGYEMMQPSSIDLGTALYMFEKLFPQKNVWYTEHNSAEYTNPVTQYNLFSEMTTEFVVRSGESVYYSFHCRIYFPPGGIQTASARFVVDGIQILTPVLAIKVDNTITDSWQTSILLFSESLSPGTHNVTVEIYGTSTSIYFDDCNILVQTYTT